MEPTLAALEAAVRADLSAPGPRLVLGDHLQQLGDPAGALVALQHADAMQPTLRRAHAYLESERQALLGPLPRAFVSLGWFCGSVKSVRLERDLSPQDRERALEALPQLRVGRFVEEISIDAGANTSLARSIELTAGFPSLRRLAVTGGVAHEEWPALDAAELRALDFTVPGPHRANAVAASRLPRLESLKLKLEAALRPEALRAALERHEGLTALALDGAAVDDAFVEWLVGLTAFRKLETLALTGGRLTIAGARALAAAKPRLEVLDVSNNRLEPAAKPVLMRHAARLVFGHHDVDAVVERNERPDGWVVLDRHGFDVDLAMRTATLLGKHGSVREVVLEHSEQRLGGREITVLRLLGVGGALKLDAFTESLARRTAQLPRSEKFKALCLHRTATTAAYRLYDESGLVKEAAGADDEVLAEGLAQLGVTAVSGFAAVLNAEGSLRSVIDEYRPAPQRQVTLSRDAYLAFADVDVDFAPPEPERDEDWGECFTCDAEGTVYPCDDCGHEICQECARQPERREAWVCRDCEESGGPDGLEY